MDKIPVCLKNAELSYCDVSKWENKNVIYKKFNNTTTNLVNIYHYYEEDTLYISIRGSDCFMDILDDIDIYKVQFKEYENETVYLHDGFYSDFCEIKLYIEEIINSKPINTIYLTGHSKGAAIVIITSLYIASKFNNIKVYCIGFGCPRVGCKKFVECYNKLLSSTTFLIRTEFDIIPQLPIYGYYDVMSQYMVKDNKILPYTPEDSIVKIIHSNFKYHKLYYYKMFSI
jgi:predicted lipase